MGAWLTTVTYYEVDLDIAQQGIDAIAAELGVASVAANEIYQPAQ